MTAIKADENLPEFISDLLVAAGHDCVTVIQQALTGVEDLIVDAVCRAEGRVLLTLDLGFADVRRFPPSERSGTVVLRPDAQTRSAFDRVATKLLGALASESPANQLWVVEPDRIRRWP